MTNPIRFLFQLAERDRAAREAKRRAREEAAFHRHLERRAIRYARTLLRTLARRGYCRRWRRRGEDGGEKIQYLHFADIYYDPGGTQILYRFDPQRMPIGVGLYEMKEDAGLEYELSAAIQHTVKVVGNPMSGIWLVVELEGGIRGVPTHVKWADVMREFPETAPPLMLPLGVAANSRKVYRDLTRFPHLLVAGATGSGKSNLLHVLICSLIKRNSPDDVRFIFFDFKGGVELTAYEKLPHLLMPIIEEPSKALPVLREINKEIDRRSALMKGMARNVEKWNKRGGEHWPYWIVLIDEAADLLLDPRYKNEAELLISEAARKARFCGIHLIFSTQRPDTRVITGLIKSQFPARIAGGVASKHDSMTIIDNGHAAGLEPVGRVLFVIGQTEMEVQTPEITDRIIARTVNEAVSAFPAGKKIKLRPLSERIALFALEHLNGECRGVDLWDEFRGEIPKNKLERMLQRLDNRILLHQYNGECWELQPPAGQRPRRLIPTLCTDHPKTGRDNEDQEKSTLLEDYSEVQQTSDEVVETSSEEIEPPGPNGAGARVFIQAADFSDFVRAAEVLSHPQFSQEWMELRRIEGESYDDDGTPIFSTPDYWPGYQAGPTLAEYLVTREEW